MTLRILGRVSSINVRKVLWTCDEIGHHYTREDWGIGFRPTKDAQFLALNPKALVPVMIDGDVVLTESNTICRYLAAKNGRTDLLPSDLVARAQVESWMDWQSADLNSAYRYAFQAVVRKNPAFADQAQIEASITEWHARMLILEAHLAKVSPFVCGGSFTLADVLLGLSINRWVRFPRAMPALPAVSDYFERLLSRPASKGYLGEGTD